MHPPQSTNPKPATVATTTTTPSLAGKRIALAHDWLVGYRGGEAVLHHIARALTAHGAHPAALFTLFDDRRPLTPDIDALPKRASVLNTLPNAPTKLRRWLLPLYKLAVKDLSKALAAEHRRSPFDLLISTSSAAIKNIASPVPHLCYCHTPPRYIWSQTDQYNQGLKGIGLALIKNHYKRWDQDTHAVTRFLANSAHTRAEIARCYNRDAHVLHPPVRTDFFVPASTPRTDHWLCVGALEPYKRFDLAIAAANKRNHPLTIAGTGSDETRLRKLAGPTVTFAGRVPDDQLRHLFQTARCLLFPQVEDFGIVAVEALATGTPAVARNQGGALDSITPSTGSFFTAPTPDALLAAIDDCPPNDESTTTACRTQALHFTPEAFESALTHHATQLL